MDPQSRVASFVTEHDLEAPAAFRLLDLVAEVGELAKDALASSDYGATPETLSIAEDELGDVLFATYALVDGLDLDGHRCLAVALDKYETRLEGDDTPASST